MSDKRGSDKDKTGGKKTEKQDKANIYFPYLVETFPKGNESFKNTS